MRDKASRIRRSNLLPPMNCSHVILSLTFIRRHDESNPQNRRKVQHGFWRMSNIMLDIIFLDFSSSCVENGISINLGLNEKIGKRVKSTGCRN